MSTGAEFARHQPPGPPGPHAPEARLDEELVRILFVEDRTDLAEAVHRCLGSASRGCFDVIREHDLARVTDRVESGGFDLLLIDLSVAEGDRSTVIDCATEFAHRLPVVVLTGLERFADRADPSRAPSSSIGDAESSAGSSCHGLGACVANADVPGKLRGAIRRSRRLGPGGGMSPIFCRIDGLCGETAFR